MNDVDSGKPPPASHCCDNGIQVRCDDEVRPADGRSELHHECGCILCLRTSGCTHTPSHTPFIQEVSKP